MHRANYEVDEEESCEDYVGEFWGQIAGKTKDSLSESPNGPHRCSRVLQRGEIIDQRYRVSCLVGQGAFGRVYQAYDMKREGNVAVKITKSRHFQSIAENEVDLLETIKVNDVEGVSCTLPLLDHFVYKRGLCIVLELQSINLYRFLQVRKFRGVSLCLIKKYAKQICTALSFLAKPELNIIHGDLKPENILICGNDSSRIKIADFGTACFEDQVDVICVQTTYYRSPEILLGAPYNKAIDMWSAGCILVEMHVGKPLFKGIDNFDQINKIIEIMGMPPRNVLTSGIKTRMYFTRTCMYEDFKLKTMFRNYCEPGMLKLDKILGVEDGGPSGLRLGEAGHAIRDYFEFQDFIEQMLDFDPAMRIVPSHALEHSFVTRTADTNVTSKLQKWMSRSLTTKCRVNHEKDQTRAKSDTSCQLSRFSPLHRHQVLKSRVPTVSSKATTSNGAPHSGGDQKGQSTKLYPQTSDLVADVPDQQNTYQDSPKNE